LSGLRPQGRGHGMRAPGLIASLVQCFFQSLFLPFRPRITMAAAPAREAASSARYSASWAVSPVGTESSGSSGCP
ncbi:hypothetical protein LEFCBN_LEFCBN_12020, partial [Dysosmobacter welbionis]